VNNKCNCSTGFTGPKCDVPISNDPNKAKIDPTIYTLKNTFLEGDYELHWSKPANNEIMFALKAKTSGFVAVGFSTAGSMIGSDAVIGWFDGNTQTEHVKAYKLTGKSANLVIESQKLVITQTSAAEADGFTVIKFTRKITDNGDVTFDTTGANSKTIVAIGNSDILIAHAPNRRVNNIANNFVTGSSLTTFNPLRIIHGAMMFIAWGLLLPLGGYLARYRGPKLGCLWFPAHQSFQISGIILSFGGYILAFFIVEGAHFQGNNRIHAFLGSAIILGSAIQFFLALARPHQPQNDTGKYDKTDPNLAKPTCYQACCECKSPTKYTPWRLIWERKHRYLGRFLFIAAMVNIFLGANLLGTFYSVTVSLALLIIYAVISFIEVLVVIIKDCQYKKWICCKSAGETV